MKKFWWIIIVVVIIAVVVFNLNKNGKSGKEEQTHQVKGHVVEKGEIVIKLEETGEIRPVREIEQKSRVSGKVTKLYVDEGDYVNMNDVIAEVEPDYNQASELTQKNRSLRNAEISLANAQRNFDNKKKLYDEGFVSEIDLDSFRDNLEKAEIDYNSALVEYESIKEIETVNNVTKIYATASGTVIRKDVEEGEMVVSSSGTYSSGTVLMVLADLTQMIIASEINEVDISKVAEGMEVSIQLDAYPYEKYSGSITRIAPMAQQVNQVKVFPLEIDIDQIDDRLKPGLTANLTIIGERRSDIVVVPIRTIFSDEMGNDIVYKVKNDTISGKSTVKTGINDFQQVEIIQGIAEGDTISLTEPKKAASDRMNMMFD